jgi:lipopolysaccharide biosynthesis glycosyltransferase
VNSPAYPTLDWTSRPDRIDIACTSDWRYLPHTAAMLHSLFSNSPGERFRVVLLHGIEIDEENRSRLQRLADAFLAEIHPVRIVPERIAGLPILHLHRSVWYRVLLPETLPQLDRILYLDSDMIVLDRVRPLWDSDVSQHLFAGVGNALYPFNPDMVKLLELPDTRAYLNSGVMLMNLARMRAEDSTARIFDYAPQHPQNPAQDQDAYSALFHDRCLRVAPRWNTQINFFDLGAVEVSRQIGAPVAEVEAAMARPAIVHFIGPFKPWRVICRYPQQKHYLAHLRQTPWPMAPLEKITPFDRWVRPLPVVWQDRYFRLWGQAQPALKSLRAVVRRLRALRSR